MLDVFSFSAEHGFILSTLFAVNTFKAISDFLVVGDISMQKISDSVPIFPNVALSVVFSFWKRFFGSKRFI